MPKVKKIKLEQENGAGNRPELLLTKRECPAQVKSQINLDDDFSKKLNVADVIIEDLEMVLATVCMIEYNVNHKIDFSFGKLDFD